MAMEFFWIPVRAPGAPQDELNRTIRSHRVVSTERHFSGTESDAGWAVCVEFVEGASEANDGGKDDKRIDYREILSPADFEVYSALRALRKQLAEEAGVPIYSVMTNAQMAELVRRRPTDSAGFQEIDRVGAEKAAKYWPRIEAVLAAAKSGTTTGARTGPT